MEELIRQFIDICSGIGWLASTLTYLQFNILLWCIQIPFIFLSIMGHWGIYSKAGRPGWFIFIPFVNVFSLLNICKIPYALFFLFILVHIGAAIMGNFTLFACNFIWYVVYFNHKLSQAYGRGTLFTLGLIFLGGIFGPLLGLGNYEYEG